MTVARLRQEMSVAELLDWCDFLAVSPAVRATPVGTPGRSVRPRREILPPMAASTPEDMRAVFGAIVAVADKPKQG